MPHSAQAKKRVRQDERRRMHNRSLVSAMRTAIKRVEEACTAKDAEAAKTNLSNAMKRIDKCAKRNIVHKNNASRKKGRLARLVAAI